MRKSKIPDQVCKTNSELQGSPERTTTMIPKRSVKLAATITAFGTIVLESSGNSQRVKAVDDDDEDSPGI
jgi:hypothetical protein